MVYGGCPTWHPPGIDIPRGMRSESPWHSLGIRLVCSGNRASIPVAIAPGPQRGNRGGSARKTLLKPGASLGFVLIMQANIQLPIDVTCMIYNVMTMS